MLENKKRIIGLTFMGVLLLIVGFTIGCFTPRLNASSNTLSNAKISDEGLPKMDAYGQSVYDAYLKPIIVTGILWRNFSPEDMSELLNEPDTLFSLVLTLNYVETERYLKEGMLPVEYVDEVLVRHFMLQPDMIHHACMDFLIEEKNAYSYLGGLGGGPATPVITSIELKDQKMKINYTWYIGDSASDTFSYKPDANGELIMDFTSEYPKYVSNKIIV